MTWLFTLSLSRKVILLRSMTSYCVKMRYSRQLLLSRQVRWASTYGDRVLSTQRHALQLISITTRRFLLNLMAKSTNCTRMWVYYTGIRQKISNLISTQLPRRNWPGVSKDEEVYSVIISKPHLELLRNQLQRMFSNTKKENALRELPLRDQLKSL
jgi:hypothetical protein